MAVLINTEDTVDIEKEADRTSAIANSVIDALPNILNGTLKLSQFPELCNLTLTYALYGKLVDNLKSHQVKQTNNLPVILKFLFPDLAQFLPPSIFTLTTQVRRFINKAYRLGHLKSLYQPVSKLYSAKSSSEWEDFRKWGINQDMLVTGPLVPSSGCKMQLTNRHVILLLNLRNKYRLCWVKVVPQWLRFFGILQADDCVQLQDIKGHWVGLGVQADKLKGTQLQEFLNTPYTLPKSFIKKNVDSMTSSVNFKLPGIDKKKYISAYLKENQRRVESLQKQVNKLRSQLTGKDKEISAYQKKLSQAENKLEHLATRLCKMRLVKNHWFMKYRSMSGINLFAEDFEFNADLTYAQKIREGARYIKRILQLRYSDQSTRFVENFLDDSFIEELLENILVHEVGFDKSSNILSEILQELVKQSQRKSVDNLEWQQNKNNSDLDSLLMHSQLVPHENNSMTSEDVLVISDSDSSLFDDDSKRSQSVSKTLAASSFDKTGCSKPGDLCNKKDSGNLLMGTHNQQPISSAFIEQEYPEFLSSNDSISGLCNDEEMLNNAYILYDMIIHKRPYDTSEEPSRDSGHASQEDASTYQPKTKILRLERQKTSPVVNSDSSPSYDSSLLPLLFENETCSSPFEIKESHIKDLSKPSEKGQDILTPSVNPNDKDSEFGKPQNDLWTLDNEDVSSLQSNCTLEPNFGSTEDAEVVALENTIVFESILPNSDSPLETLDKQVCQEKNLNSKINLASSELVQNKIQSLSKVFDDSRNNEEKSEEHKTKKKRRKN